LEKNRLSDQIADAFSVRIQAKEIGVKRGEAIAEIFGLEIIRNSSPASAGSE